MPDDKESRKPNLPGVSAQLEVLKRMSKDADFRVSFLKDPVRAVANANITISTSDLLPLTRLTPEHYETMLTVGRSGTAIADNSEALAYLVFCVLAFLTTLRPEGMPDIETRLKNVESKIR